VAASTDASVALTFTTRDQASPGIQRIGGNLTRLQSSAAGVGKVFANNATAFLTAGLALSSIGGQASGLLVKFGVLNEKQGDIVNTTVQIAAVVLGAITAFSSLGLAIGASSVGFGVIGAAIVSFTSLAVVLVGVIASLTTGFQLLADPANLSSIEKLTGVRFPTFDRPGEEPSRLGRLGGFALGGLAPGLDPQRLRESVEQTSGFLSRTGLGGVGNPGGGSPIIIQAGTIVADEGGMRELEKRLRQIRKEDERTRGISK